MYSIKAKLLLLLLPVVMLLLGGIGYFNYLKMMEMTTRSVEENLRTAVRDKEAALIEYIESTEKIGAAIAASEVVQTYAELTNRKLSGNNLKTLDTLERRVENLLYGFQEVHWGRYGHIFLINRSNQIVISPKHGAREKGLPSALLGQDMLRDRWAMETMQKGKTMLSDYAKSETSGLGIQSLFYPVRDESNQVQAVIGFELQVPYQQQLVKDGFKFGESGQIYLVNSRGVPVDYLTVSSKIPLTGDALTQTKLKGTASAHRTNAQGREVISVFAKHQRYPWILVAEIETAEIYAEIYELQTILAAGIGVTLVVLAILCLYFAGGIARPTLELSEQVQKLSRGEFSIEIPETRRKDEIGRLTESLQQLVFSLQIVAKKLREAKALKTKVMKAKAMKARGMKKAS